MQTVRSLSSMSAESDRFALASAVASRLHSAHTLCLPMSRGLVTFTTPRRPLHFEERSGHPGRPFIRPRSSPCRASPSGAPFSSSLEAFPRTRTSHSRPYPPASEGTHQSHQTEHSPQHGLTFRERAVERLLGLRRLLLRSVAEEGESG